MDKFEVVELQARVTSMTGSVESLSRKMRWRNIYGKEVPMNFAISKSIWEVNTEGVQDCLSQKPVLADECVDAICQ